MNAPQAVLQTPEAKAAYDARFQRLMDCVALKQPDRMPTALFCTFWMAKFAVGLQEQCPSHDQYEILTRLTTCLIGCCLSLRFSPFSPLGHLGRVEPQNR